jgi:hypothetical protein
MCTYCSDVCAMRHMDAPVESLPVRTYLLHSDLLQVAAHHDVLSELTTAAYCSSG